MTGGSEEILRQRDGGKGTDTQAGIVPAQLGTRYLQKILHKISTEAFSSDQINRARLLCWGCARCRPIATFV